MLNLQVCKKNSTFAAHMDMLSLIRSSGVRNFAKLLSANIIAQIIGLLVYPILTRIYAPEDFGLLNLFLSISGVIVVLSTAEYYNAIVLPKKEKDAVSVVHLCLLMLLCTVGIVALSTCFSDQIAQLFNEPALANYYWLMPLLVLVLGGWNILNYWYVRETKYTRISGYQLSQSIFSAGTKVGFGSMGFLQGGMIYSVVLAPAISLFLSISFSWRNLKKIKVRPSWCGIVNIARYYHKFPYYSLPRSFINMLAGQLPILLLTPLFGARYIGWWSMALLLGFIPISVITKSIYQVLYQYTTNCVNNKQPLAKYFKRFTMFVLFIGIPLFGMLYFLIPLLTSWFLGPGWELTGVYIRWMLPWLLFSILTSSTGFLADVFFKQQIGFIFEVFTAILRTIGVVIGILCHNFTISIACYAIGTALAVLAQYIWLVSLVKKYDDQLISINDA